MDSFITANEPKRQSFHIANKSSSSNSVQNVSSKAPARSKSRSNDPQAVQPQISKYPDGLPSETHPVIDSSESERRRHSRSSSLGGVRDGVANLNRWSKSTASSREIGHKGTTSISRRMSSGGSGAFNFGIESPPKKLQKSRPSTANSNSNSPSRQIQASELSSNPIAKLPPILTLPSLQTSANTNSPATGSPSTAGLLSAAYRSTAQGEDYFTGNWKVQTRDFSQKRSPSGSRSASVDPSLSSGSGLVTNGTTKKAQPEEESRPRRHSRNRSQATKSSAGTGSSPNSKQPSQKAMLSKALQKANTAVLLDNAQNFEGAMQAYSEACTLLQQVMQRSSGDQDKRKLEAIVSFVQLLKGAANNKKPSAIHTRPE